MTQANDPSAFKALVVRKDGEISMGLETVDLDFLPPKGVLIRVHASSINYKDLLSCRGDIMVTRRFPHVPGIDAAGVVVASDSEEFQVGDPVIASSFDLGMNTPGGFGEYIRVPPKWITKLPATMGFASAMAVGTAGYTAFLATNRISDHLKGRGKGTVLVTGSTGGVGSMAICFLRAQGFSVAAVTTKPGSADFLHSLGADEVLNAEEFINHTNRGLLPERFDAAVDVAGGDALTTALRTVKAGGIVCSVGMVSSTQFSMSVMPFILRGVTLAGINADLNHAHRTATWSSISEAIATTSRLDWVEHVTLDQLPHWIRQKENGAVLGRTVVIMKDVEE